ncbi:hypothetical protein [Vibrio ziniensis]|nr:hypothetical protein [Vibrio ziniensis]
MSIPVVSNRRFLVVIICEFWYQNVIAAATGNAQIAINFSD